MKTTMGHKTYDSLIRLMMYMGSLTMIAILTVLLLFFIQYLFSFMLTLYDNLYVKNWAIALSASLFLDQLLVEVIITAIRIIYRRGMKNVKITQKYPIIHSYYKIQIQ